MVCGYSSHRLGYQYIALLLPVNVYDISNKIMTVDKFQCSKVLEECVKTKNWAKCTHFSQNNRIQARDVGDKKYQEVSGSNLFQWPVPHLFSTDQPHHWPADHLDLERWAEPGWTTGQCESAEPDSICLENVNSDSHTACKKQLSPYLTL